MAAVKTTRPVPCNWMKASRHAGASGAQPAPVMATSRPPCSSRAKAEAIWRSAASFTVRSTCATAENGGFIRMTLGRAEMGMRSSIDAASCLLTATPENKCDSSAALPSASSFSTSLAPASSAWIANMPVPAEGSSTVSPTPIEAATTATNDRPAGVEYCCKAWLVSERRVWVGMRADTRSISARERDREPPREKIAGPKRRRKRICATSQAS